MTTLKERRARLSDTDRADIDRIKADMEHEAVLYRLRQLREDAGYSQKSLAEIIGVGQNRISQMEHGLITSARVSTLRKYIEATGGELELLVKRPDGTRVPLAI